VALEVLLDTTAYSQFRRGHAATVDRVRRAERIRFSVIVMGELLAGFHRGSRFEGNARSLEDFLGESRVLLQEVSGRTAERFGLVMNGLRAKGRPIPTNDVWIAAQAMETGAQLLSFDRDFQYVDGLDWVWLN
jgi:predicted nucleic acid-binding protein